jgi:hypothetical protein
MPSQGWPTFSKPVALAPNWPMWHVTNAVFYVAGTVWKIAEGLSSPSGRLRILDTGPSRFSFRFGDRVARVRRRIRTCLTRRPGCLEAALS